MEINVLTSICGYFFSACHDSSPNNGYNCQHPECEAIVDGVGCCYVGSCPVGHAADEEHCEEVGLEYDETAELMVADININDYDNDIMWKIVEGN